MQSLLLCPADLDAYLRELPVATAVLPQLQMLLLSDESYIEEVVELVRMDPALATRVMQMAGSAYFGQGREVESLDSAIAVLGCRECYRVTAAYAMSRYINTPLKIYGMPPAEYWRRSLACALLMEESAPDCGLDGCVAYTVGLLHSIGMVLIDRHLRSVGDSGMVIKEMPGVPVPRQEQRLVGMNHAQVAALALRRWYFSADIVASIEFQYEPMRAPVAQQRMAALLADVRQLAQDLVHRLPPPTRLRADAPLPEVGQIGKQILAVEVMMH
jgi:HD-like signal output (HDOD) protein